MTNNSSDQLIFNQNESLSVLNLRSIGYYKLMKTNIQHHLESYYEFRLLQAFCVEFNKLTNTPIREDQKSTDPYPRLAEHDKRKNPSDRKILDKYVNLESSCLTQKKKGKLKEMLYKFKDSLSLRDEMDTCPNIEVN